MSAGLRRSGYSSSTFTTAAGAMDSTVTSLLPSTRKRPMTWPAVRVVLLELEEELLALLRRDGPGELERELVRFAREAADGPAGLGFAVEHLLRIETFLRGVGLRGMQRHTDPDVRRNRRA